SARGAAATLERIQDARSQGAAEEGLTKSVVIGESASPSAAAYPVDVREFDSRFGERPVSFEIGGWVLLLRLLVMTLTYFIPTMIKAYGRRGVRTIGGCGQDVATGAPGLHSSCRD